MEGISSKEREGIEGEGSRWHRKEYGMGWDGKRRHGMVWYGMVWYGMAWYGMVWHGMVWYMV